MALIEICHRIGEPPVELPSRSQSLFIKRFGLYRVAGKIVNEAELKVFERRKTVEFLEFLERRLRPRQIAHRDPGPGARQRADIAVQPVVRQRLGARQRTGFVTGFGPVNQQDKVGDRVRTVEFQRFFGQRQCATEMPVIGLHQKGAADHLRRSRIGAQGLLIPPRGGPKGALLLRVPARQISPIRRSRRSRRIGTGGRRACRCRGRQGAQDKSGQRPDLYPFAHCYPHLSLPARRPRLRITYSDNLDLRLPRARPNQCSAPDP